MQASVFTNLFQELGKVLFSINFIIIIMDDAEMSAELSALLTDWKVPPVYVAKLIGKYEAG
jgi:hypothetical protein